MKWIRSRLEGMQFENQLILLVLIPLLFLAVTVISVSSYALRTSTEALILQRNTTAVGLAASSIVQDLCGYERPLITAAGYLAATPGDRKAQQASLEQWKGFLDVFDGGVTLLDASGQAVASTPDQSGRLGLSYGFRDYFQQVRQTSATVYSPLLFEQPSGQMAVVIAVPVLVDGKFSGVLIGVFFLRQHSWIRNIETLQSQSASQAYLVDADGNIIYHTDLAQIGRNISGEGDLSHLIQQGRADSLVYHSRISNSDWVASYAPLGSTRWGIVIEEPWQALIDPTRGYVWTLVGSMILGLGVAVIMLVAGLRRGIRPLLELMHEAQQVTAGSSFHPLEEQGPQELRALTRTFNQMVTNLKEQQQALRNYSRLIIESQEEERLRISRDLHDETVQDLVGLTQRLELCRTMLVRDPAAARQRLDELQSLTERALADVRRMSNDLRPLILEDLGLAAAVRKLCQTLGAELPAADVLCQVSGSERRLTPEQELVVFRVVQEALNNIRKHARSAAHVTVDLVFRDHLIEAVVVDDGPGFEIASLDDIVRQGHLGLAGMVERSRLFDGDLKITPVPGQGTHVRLCLPV